MKKEECVEKFAFHCCIASTFFLRFVKNIQFFYILFVVICKSPFCRSTSQGENLFQTLFFFFTPCARHGVIFVLLIFTHPIQLGIFFSSWSGLTSCPNRARTLPSRPMTNLVKFQAIFPRSAFLRKTYVGCVSVPFTSARSISHSLGNLCFCT